MAETKSDKEMKSRFYVDSTTDAATTLPLKLDLQNRSIPMVPYTRPLRTQAVFNACSDYIDSMGDEDLFNRKWRPESLSPSVATWLLGSEQNCGSMREPKTGQKKVSSESTAGSRGREDPVLHHYINSLASKRNENRFSRERILEILEDFVSSSFSELVKEHDVSVPKPKSRRKKRSKKVLSQNIEGYIDSEDIDTLLEYLNS